MTEQEIFEKLKDALDQQIMTMCISAWNICAKK